MKAFESRFFFSLKFLTMYAIAASSYTIDWDANSDSLIRPVMEGIK